MTLSLTYDIVKIIMQTQPISVKYLRENFTVVKERLKSGFSFILIYRSEPIARIEPFKKGNTGNTIVQTLLNQPGNLQFYSNKSAVDLVRQERD